MLAGFLVLSRGFWFPYTFFSSMFEDVILNICGLCIVFFCYGFQAARRVGCLTLACVFALICLSCLLSGSVKRVVTDDVNY